MTTVVSFLELLFLPVKDDAVVSLSPDPLLFLHHFLGLYLLPTATPVTDVTLKVYISGAVQEPGVYTVNEGDRLADVIATAGGVAENADLAAVNLAARVEDEDHWHVPQVGETPETSLVQEASPSRKIDLNSADIELLKSLPGIGEVKAQSIISYRETNGSYSSVEELLDVSGIGPATIEAIHDLVEIR